MSSKKKEKVYTVTIGFKDKRYEVEHYVKSIGGANDPHFLVIIKDGGFIMFPKNDIASVFAKEE